MSRSGKRTSEESLRFLAEAGLLLAAPLDDRALLQGLAQMAVPTLGDWCSVYDLTQDGTPQRLAAAHVDPTRAEDIARLLHDFPPDAQSTQLVADMLRSGQSLLAPNVSDAPLTDDPRDPTYLEILRRMGIRSFVAVPLRARGQTFGALALFSATEGWHGQDDLELAEELAGRAALALDNLRLLHEARETSRQAHESLAQYRALVERLPTSTYIYLASLEDDSVPIYVSPNAETILGFPLSRWYVAPDLWASRLHPDDRDHVLAEMERSRSLGEPLRTEYRMLARDGSVVWVRDDADVIRDEEGTPRFIQGFAQDVTERKRAEHERALLVAEQTERARLAGVLLAARTMAHHVNNQLALTVGYGELLATHDRLPEDLRELAAEAMRGAQEAATTVAKLQRVARLEELPPVLGDSADASMLDLDRSSGPPTD